MARPKMSSVAEYDAAQSKPFNMTPDLPTFDLTPKARRRSPYKPFAKCSHKTPCGGECQLNSAYVHHYHSCSTKDCPHCHDSARFGRAEGPGRQ